MFSPKILAWRRFRAGLNSLELSEALKQISQFWAFAPFTPYYLDYRTPSEWPDPWTLVAEDVFCDLAKAIVIIYTLYFTNHGTACHIELKIFKCKDTGYEYNLVWIDNGKYILNYSRDVVNKEQLPDSFKLIKSYSLFDLGADKY